MLKKVCGFLLVLILGLLGGCCGPIDSIPSRQETIYSPETTSPALPETTEPSVPAFAVQPEETEPSDPIVDPVQELLDSMPLHEKVGQLFIVCPDALDSDANASEATALSESMRQFLADYPVGGVVFFRKNILEPSQITSFLQDLQYTSKIPLFTAVDEEGGLVARLARNPAFDLPQYSSMGDIGNTGDPSKASEVGRTIGGYLAKYGFNLDFAPDADVNTNPRNPVIGTRAFSSDPEIAARMVAAAVQGFHDSGTICCIKHFPGHGDTAEDSHYGCATTSKTWEEMQQCELLPFVGGIEAGADMVMVGSITAPNVTDDSLPASLSYEMITERLRKEMGYSGIVITDSMTMGAITQYYSSGEAACKAVEAGADIILMPEDLVEAYDAVEQAVLDGEIREERLNESVLRILQLKERYGLL